MFFSEQIGFFDFVVIGNEIWFYNTFDKSIVSVNLNKNEYKLEALDELAYGAGKMHYGTMMLVKEKLFFMPRNETRILIFDIEKKRIDYIELDQVGCGFEKPLFVSMCLKNNSLLMVPGRYPFFAEVDIKTGEVNYYATEAKRNSKRIGLYTNCNVVTDKRFAIVYTQGTGLTFFDFETKKQHIIKLDNMYFEALSALKVDNSILFAGDTDTITIYNLNENTTELIEEYVDCSPPREGFAKLLSYKDDIYALALNQSVIYVLSIRTKTIREWIRFDWGHENRAVWEYFTQCDIIGAKIWNDSLLMYSTLRNCIIEISFLSKRIRYYDRLVWQEKNKTEFINKQIEENKTTIEGTIRLEEFITYLKQLQ